MARKPDSERIYEARRAAILSRLTTRGVPANIAEARIVAWEAMAASEGRQRFTAAFWDGAAEWTAERRKA